MFEDLNPNDLSSPQAADELHRLFWSQGFLRYILKEDLQRRVYDFTHDWKDRYPSSALPIVWDLHRAAGKTFMLCLVCAERAMWKPGQEIRFGAETEGKCEEIVEPNFRKIFGNFMPPGFHAEFRRSKASPYYECYNPTWPAGSFPSRIWIIGCRERADIHRGKRSNMVVLDECREIDAFEYVAKVVFGPQFATMERPVYIMSSTPPESMDHAWSRVYRAQAVESGRYYCGPSEPVDGYAGDGDWTPEDDLRMVELFGSKESTDYQREMLCRHISDPTRLIVPEFSYDRHTVELHIRPQRFIPLIVADGGYIDYFATLFGYVDFERQKLIVEDSIIVKRKHLGQIAKLLDDKTKKLYAEPTVKNDRGDFGMDYPITPRRFADMKPGELAEIGQVYHQPFAPASNHDPDAQIAHLRTLFAQDKILIHRNNEILIRQLQNAIRDERGKLTRSEEFGHWDAVMALVYMARNAPWLVNPLIKERPDFTLKNFPRRPPEPRKGYPRSILMAQLRRRYDGSRD
jgi:hypothetical protein